MPLINNGDNEFNNNDANKYKFGALIGGEKLRGLHLAPGREDSWRSDMKSEELSGWKLWKS